MDTNKSWKGLDELHEEASFVELRDKEFADEIPVEEIIAETLTKKSAGRRDFLKLMGFSVTAATVAASCRIPVKKAIPYAIKPEEIVPGLANYYASTYVNGTDYCSVLVKVRDGRPIKIEGNNNSIITKGGTSARVQASVLSLYDNRRHRQPSKGGAVVEWAQIDSEITEKLKAIKAANGQIRILSNTIISPSTLQVINNFVTEYPTTKHVTYEPISYSAIADANEKSFGKRAIPGYNFDKANVIAAFACDFLGTWISPVEYTKQYITNRKVSKEKSSMSRHYHVESRLSLTGSNADIRIPLKPSDVRRSLVSLYNKIASATGGTPAGSVTIPASAEASIGAMANDLLAAKGSSLVVCGINDINCQTLANAINNLLGNYGNTIDLNNHSTVGQANDKAVNDLISELNSGAISAVILYHSNPVYSTPKGKALADAIKKAQLSVAISDRADETASLAQYSCPDHHYLESWNDAEPKSGSYSLTQPTISPLFNTRQGQDSLLKWSGSSTGFDIVVQNYWSTNLFSKQSKFTTFDEFWENSVRYGVFNTTPATSSFTFNGDAASAASAVSAVKSSENELVLFESIAIGNGNLANNPWLQELPDPITKATWDNFVSVPVQYAIDNGIEDGDLVTIKAAGSEITIPAIRQPGQAKGTFAIALGYGRSAAGPAGNGVGQNAYPFVGFDGTNFTMDAMAATLSAADGKHVVARTQTHHSIEGRPVIRETALYEYKKNPASANEDKIKEKEYTEASLYPEHEYSPLKWYMNIDLNSCIGCGACAVACTAENNVPVVGKNEVARAHEMHWMRIDRYYSFVNPNSGLLEDRVTKEKEYDNQFSSAFVKDYENVNVAFQPMLCQHCENAPCENVCPVAATNHSTEGINQMAYNRCIGTRYCANNCPYKVRRFNWLDYTTSDSFPNNTATETQRVGMLDNITRMVLNPDVTVRSRGVMEKCSFCVQRIQDVKLQAKKENRTVAGDEVKTACQTSCPADAIVFGNIKDSNSSVHKLKADERTYHVLSELDTAPSVGYMVKVRNIEEKKSNA
jgi:molybdopterin-containing oxidoreductase family iron-sulfur binding subunit